MSTPKAKRRFISRRQFLIGAGAVGGALTLGIALGLPVARLKVAGMLGDGEQPSNAPNTPSLWLEITPENKVRLRLPKVEMGQGVFTALAQIAAEDLEAAWAQMEVTPTSTAHGFASGLLTTSGSSTIPGLYQPLREAGALLRAMLVAEAAAQFGVTAEALSVAEGEIFVTADPAQKRTFGAIVQNKVGEWVLPKTVPTLKAAKAFRLIGQPLPRVDLLQKVQGQAIYGLDVRVPNMLYGAVARPPKLGATLKRTATGEALQRPGVMAVVTDSDFAGVVAETRTQAFAALTALDVEWTFGSNVQQSDIDALVTVKPGQGQLVQDDGNVESAWSTGELITAEYRTPMAVHAHLEPQTATVEVHADKVVVWVATQSLGQVQEDVARALNRKPETVEVNATYLGGGFGRRTTAQVAVEAARLAVAAGRPVHVAWTRGDEFRQGAVRPPTHHVLKAALQGGRIQALEHHQASGPVFPHVFSQILGADFGAWRGALVRYAIPHRRTRAQPVELPLKTTFWRGLGLLANVFALESFMDELAKHAQADPLAFRLQHLPTGELGERYKRVLETVAERAAWGQSLPAGHGQGIAISLDANTVVAQVAEVQVTNGQIQVQKFTSVVDGGLIVNPNIAAQQAEGAIVMGLSSALKETLTVQDGNITATNFDRYPLLTIKEVPEIAVHFVQSSESPHGLGEPPLGPVAAAVANAVFAATGQRLRQWPLQLK